jgi:hypothetical protein
VQFLELTSTGYEAREEGGVVATAAEGIILANAPLAEGDALPITGLIDGTSIKASTARKVADDLVTRGQLRRRGEGRKGDPYLYWRVAPEAAP